MSASRGPTDDSTFQPEGLRSQRTAGLRPTLPIFADSALDPESGDMGQSAESGPGGPRRGLSTLIGSSAAMQVVYRCIVKVAPSATPVMIIGESGVGKELAAQVIHQRSTRASQPCVAVNCGALLESDHANGQQDDAEYALEDPFAGRGGFFEQADGGTLLLDDLTQLPEELQGKLLRALEDPLPLSGQVGCRVIATTPCDPERAVREGLLRADLFYRLAAFPIHMPALRDREGDAAMLAKHFLAQLNAEHASQKRFSQESLACIARHPWPGNVRELRNAVQCAFILAEDQLDVTAAIVKTSPGVAPGDPNALRIPIGTALSDVERCMIVATLKRCGGNKTRAAAVLGVSLKTLYNRLNEYRAAGLMDDKFARLAGIVA